MNLIENFNAKARNYGLNVRLVTELDAEKILKLRTDNKIGRHLAKTNPDLINQINYIRDYKTREKNGQEYYFAFSIIGSDEVIGFYRLYNIDYKTKSFTIGSWIFEPNIPENLAILGDILSKEFGFNEIGLNICYFDVRRNNKKVKKYHGLFSPIFINEDSEENNYYVLTRENFEINKIDIMKFIF